MRTTNRKIGLGKVHGADPYTFYNRLITETVGILVCSAVLITIIIAARYTL